MEAVISNFDEYLKAFGLTIGLFVVSGIGALVFGTILAVLRVGPVSILNKAAALYVTLFRNTPLLMIFVFMAIAMPVLGYNFKFVEDVEIAGYNVSAFFFRACVALTLYTSAFVCEAMRSGVNAVPLGQAEAGRAIGLTFGQSMREIVLPQATRAVDPADDQRLDRARSRTPPSLRPSAWPRPTAHDAGASPTTTPTSASGSSSRSRSATSSSSSSSRCRPTSSSERSRVAR